jgi:hypothetical protein
MHPNNFILPNMPGSIGGTDIWKVSVKMAPMDYLKTWEQI